MFLFSSILFLLFFCHFLKEKSGEAECPPATRFLSLEGLG